MHTNIQKEGSIFELWLYVLLLESAWNEMGPQMVHACSPFGGFTVLRHLILPTTAALMRTLLHILVRHFARWEVHRKCDQTIMQVMQNNEI